VEEEAREAGKTWNELKRLAIKRTRWRNFTGAICSRSYTNEEEEEESLGMVNI
jgi:hypothetical protein